MYRFIFNKIKTIIPNISKTELIALKSGTTSLDRQIFNGIVQYPKYKNYISENESKFLDKDVNKLLEKYGNQDMIYPSKNFKEIFDYLGNNNFLSFIIQKNMMDLNFQLMVCHQF